LDGYHLPETHGKLCTILARWRAYRSGLKLAWRGELKRSLERISEAYEQIRETSLPEFSNATDLALRVIWDELGRLKEPNACKSEDESYNIIAVAKPLLLIWGQTLGFDSKVRRDMPKSDDLSGERRWSFVQWRKSLEFFQVHLNQLCEYRETLEEVSKKRYGEKGIVPYGRLLDIYYFSVIKGVKVLFVCTGNTERSPTAEALLRDNPNYDVKSCGTGPEPGRRPLTQSEVKWASMIFAMEERHKAKILEMVPKGIKSKTQDKIRVLGIPDRYRYMDPELIDLLKRRLRENCIDL